MKMYFYTINEEDYESDDPLEIASKIYAEAEDNENIMEKVLNAIVKEMVNEYEPEQKVSPYEEAFNRQFDDALDKLKDL